MQERQPIPGEPFEQVPEEDIDPGRGGGIEQTGGDQASGGDANTGEPSTGDPPP